MGVIICGYHLWSPVVNVGVWSERHEEEASTGQHDHTAGVLSLLQDLLEVLVIHLNTCRTTGSSDLREEHEGELPLGDPQSARLPVLQLQVEVEVQLEGSGARLGRNSIKSFNHPSLTSPPPPSHLIGSESPLTVILTLFIAAKPASSG